MTATNDTAHKRQHEHCEPRWLAGLAADDYGASDDRPPLVLLHGLTFDRRTWRPALTELEAIDPGRRVLVVDLPGHGQSAGLPSHDLQTVAHTVHRAVEEAQLCAPVVVGHSISGMIATIYATLYPTSGVVNVDQPLLVAPIAQLAHSVADQIRGPGFPAVWDMFAASMQIELLPPDAQELIRSTCRPRQDLVLSYWREMLDLPVAELTGRVAAGLAAIRGARIPYLIIAGHDPEPGYRDWLNAEFPEATVTVWPRSSHFPHLAHPDLFARCLAQTARWPDGASTGRAGGTGGEPHADSLALP